MARDSQASAATDVIANFEIGRGSLAYFDDDTTRITPEDNGPCCYQKTAGLHVCITIEDLRLAKALASLPCYTQVCSGAQGYEAERIHGIDSCSNGLDEDLVWSWFGDFKILYYLPWSTRGFDNNAFHCHS